MKLRWLHRSRRITADMVRAYSEKYNISPLTAKSELQKDNTGMILQYRTWYGMWRDIPSVVEHFE